MMDEISLMGVIVSVQESSINTWEKNSGKKPIVFLRDETAVEKGMGSPNGQPPNDETKSDGLPSLPSGKAPADTPALF